MARTKFTRFLESPLGIGLLGTAGTLTGGLLNSYLDRKAQERADKYNSPREHVKRLKQAGLSPSLAYGSSGQVSSAPVKSQVDPSLGTAQGISAYQQSRLVQAQENVSETTARGNTAKAIDQEIINEYNATKNPATGKNKYAEGREREADIQNRQIQATENNLALQRELAEANRKLQRDLAAASNDQAKAELQQRAKEHNENIMLKRLMNDAQIKSLGIKDDVLQFELNRLKGIQVIADAIAKYFTAGVKESKDLYSSIIDMLFDKLVPNLRYLK